jgi:hypothetical protein
MVVRSDDTDIHAYAEPFERWQSTLRSYQEFVRETDGTRRALKTSITCILLTVVQPSAIGHDISTGGLAPAVYYQHIR